VPVTPSTTGYADVEELVKAWLQAKLGYENVTHEQPTNLRFVMPLIVVERFGGADRIITLDKPHVDLDVFAPSRAAAKAHANTIWQAMRTRMPGYIYAARTVVQNVETIAGPSHAPWDSNAQVRRFTMAYQIHLHQFAGV
jgi:hypothetical protein